jgi:PilZ domain
MDEQQGGGLDTAAASGTPSRGIEATLPSSADPAHDLSAVEPGGIRTHRRPGGKVTYRCPGQHRQHARHAARFTFRPAMHPMTKPSQGHGSDVRCISNVSSLDPQNSSDPCDDALLRLLAERLVNESATDLQTDSGQQIEFWFISATDTTVLASAPRLDVRAGLQLEWRTQLDRCPIIASLTLEEATYQSEHRARVRLRLTCARSEPKHRRHNRRALATPATLTAVICSAVVDGDWIPATLIDLSDSGIGLTTADTRPRPGDRFRLDVHLLQARLRADIRVARVSRHDHRRTYLGCSLVATAADTTEQISRILRRLDEAQGSAA